jgi:hypothetical protein
VGFDEFVGVVIKASVRLEGEYMASAVPGRDAEARASARAVLWTARCILREIGIESDEVTTRLRDERARRRNG